MSADAGDALDIEDARSWNALPLVDGRFIEPEAGGYLQPQASFRFGNVRKFGHVSFSSRTRIPLQAKF